MRTRWTTVFLSATALATAVTLNAQTPNPQRPNPQTPTMQPQPERDRPMTDDRQRPSTTAGQVVTVTGCLKEEKDVPGRNGSAMVRGHMDNDYVLTNVKMAEGSATSGIGLATMYEIKGIDAQLKPHLNHQIEVTGTLESAKDRTSTSTTADITDLNGTSVKMLSQTCSANQ